MIDPILQKFFSLGQIKVGPTIISPLASEGNFLGSIQILSTKKDFFLEKKETVVLIRDYNNTITEELFTALQYLSIDKVLFDYYMNSIYLMEWETCEMENKPDISSLRRRAYIVQK